MRLIPKNLTLKQRVTFALAALVSLFVALQAGLAYLSMHEQEDDLVDELVLAEARRLATDIDQDGNIAVDLLTLSPNFSGWLQQQDGRITPGPLPAYMQGLKAGPHRLSGETSERHIFVMPTEKGRLYMQYDALQNEEKVREFGYYLFGLTILCIVVSIVAADYLAGIVVGPMERLTHLLGVWAPGNLAQPADGGDEETRLLTAFRRVQERFEQGVAHEREFIANARHEIRTPLTALRTDLEMLALQSSEEQKLRLHRALASVDAITGSLDVAHTLSHQQSVIPQEVALAACIDIAYASLGGDMPVLGLSNQVDGEVRVMADRHSLLTILRNLIRNAAEHAAANQCTVTWTERGLEIADNGVGIPAAELPLMFDRYYRGRRLDERDGVQDGWAKPTEGRGLGLAIARQVADLNGWQLSVESTVGSGTCFILSLTSA